MSENFYIFGAGGCAKDVACIVKDLDRWDNLIGFVESVEYYNERYIFGKKVISLAELNRSFKAIVAIGDSIVRSAIVRESLFDIDFLTLIHPQASVSEWVTIGFGTVIAAGCVVTSDARLGSHVQLNVNTTVAHDCIIGDYCTTAPGVNICGNVTIAEGVNIGANACIRERITIGKNARVGMGAVVVSDLHDPVIYIGNPARKGGSGSATCK